MKISLGTIQDYLLRQRAKRHEIIKKEIEIMKVNRNFLMVTKAPQFLITKVDKRIKKLERKLVRRI